MGASREMYEDEKLAQSILLSVSQLQTQIWYNHAHTNESVFTDEILENINILKLKLGNLEREIVPKKQSEAQDD